MAFILKRFLTYSVNSDTFKKILKVLFAVDAAVDAAVQRA